MKTFRIRFFDPKSDNLKFKKNQKSAGILAVVVTIVLSGVVVEAQQSAKVPRIGYLSPTSPSVSPNRIEAFRQGLRELRYTEGKNVVIE